MEKLHISYWGLTITASVKELWEMLGSPEIENNEGDATHSNYCWNLLLDVGEGDMLLCDVYDYLSNEKFLKDEQIEWRINAVGSFASLRVKDFLMEKLNNLRNAKKN